MSKQARDRIVQRLTVVLVTLAFAYSYLHGVTWARRFSAPHSWAGWPWFIAAGPETLVAMVVLRFPESRWGLKTLVPGSVAVGWTLWVNGADRHTGASGLFVAVVMPVLSLIGMWLAHSSEPPVVEPPKKQAQSPRPRPKRQVQPRREAQEPQAQAQGPSTGPKTRAQKRPSGTAGPGSEATALEWARALSEPPSRARIMEEMGLSRSAAGRVRSALLSPAADPDVAPDTVPDDLMAELEKTS